MKPSPLRIETKFVSFSEMQDIIYNDRLVLNVRYELYKNEFTN
jgi:hypothetical protein